MARRTKAVEKNESTPEAGEKHKPQNSSSGFKAPRWLVVGGIISAIVMCLAVYLLRYDRVIGLMADDAWYILLAQAIASGHGFTLINSPSPGIIPFYPPGLPFLLSLVFRVAPRFPENVWLLKCITVVAVFGLGVACYRYFSFYRGLSRALSLAIALAVVIHPIFVFLATSTVMTEGLFTLLQMLAIISIEQCVQSTSTSKLYRNALIGAAIASFAFLTRSVGIALIAAIACYLLKERQLRTITIFVAGVVLFVSPWLIYARLHAPTEAQRIEQGGYIVYPYNEQFWMKVAGNPLLGTVSISDIPRRVWDNAVQIAGEDIGRMLAIPFFRSHLFSGYELMGYRSGIRFLSLLISAIVLLGFISAIREKVTLIEFVTIFSLVTTLLWPWYPLRFLVPCLPFVVFYFLRGVEAIYKTHQQWLGALNYKSQNITLLIMGLILCVSLYDNVAYILARSKSSPTELPVLYSRFKDNEDALNWMRNNILQDGSVVVSGNPPLIYLYTGLKSISGGDVKKNWELWKQLNVRYLAYVGNPEPFPPRGKNEQAFSAIYEAPLPNAPADAWATAQRNSSNRFEQALFNASWNIRIVDLGPPETRSDWGKRNNASNTEGQ